ncbi:MAG: GNAT family N-acetyltransferase [Sphingomonadales bacterium]
MLTITRHGVDGIDDIMAIMTSAFDPQYGESWTASQCAGVLAMPGATILIARNPGPCGFALLRTVVDEAELMLFGVSPDARCQGVGRLLLRETISVAATDGAHFYFLEVREDNPAIKLYLDEGLSIVGRRAGYYLGRDGLRRDALTFRRGLI